MKILIHCRPIFRKAKAKTNLDELAIRILLVMYYSDLPMTIGQMKEEIDHYKIRTESNNPVPGELENLAEKGYLEAMKGQRTSIYSITPKGIGVISEVKGIFDMYADR